MARNDLIIRAGSRIGSMKDLLYLLNQVKREEFGFKAHPFTMAQLMHFSDTRRNWRHYRTFAIPKRSGGERTITAPCGMLKSFQSTVNRIFQAFYDAPHPVNGFVPGRSVTDNARIHVGMNYVFNADIKDFFPSISIGRVWKALQAPPFNFSPRIASVFAGICCNDIDSSRELVDRMPGEEDTAPHRIALPQGAPSSPVLSNAVCRRLDRRLSGLARRFGLNYSRYADDITFSSQHNVYREDGDFMKEFRRIIEAEGFTLNEKKTRLQRRGQRQEVTGLVVNEKVNVTRRFVRDVDCILYIWKRYGYSAAYAKFIARYMRSVPWIAPRYPKMDSVVRGRLAYIKMVKGADSPVYQRLEAVAYGVKRRISLGNLCYVHSWRIEEFEERTGFALEYEKDEFGWWYCQFGPEKWKNHVCLSKWCRSRLTNILESGDEEMLAEFKKMNRIGLCYNPVPYGKLAPDVPMDPDHVSPYISGEYNLGSFFWLIFRRVVPSCDKKDRAKGQAMQRLSEIAPGFVKEFGLVPLAADKVRITPQISAPFEFEDGCPF